MIFQVCLRRISLLGSLSVFLKTALMNLGFEPHGWGIRIFHSVFGEKGRPQKIKRMRVFKFPPADTLFSTTAMVNFSLQWLCQYSPATLLVQIALGYGSFPN